MIKALIYATVVGLAAGTVSGQQPFRTSTEAVRVDVLVTRGRTLVRGLTAADFEIRDRGVVQEIQQIEVEQLPLNVLLVLDTSSSVAGPRLHSLLQAGRQLVSGLREPDRVALLSFATRVRLVSELTRDFRRVIAGFDQFTANGFTSLRDAAFSGLALRDRDPGRTLMVLFSDGADTSSWLPAAKVIDAARRTDVIVYGVGIRESVRFGSRTYAVAASGEFVEDLAATTGGRVMLAGNNADLARTFVTLLSEFRNRYVLSYEPRGVTAPGWHPLDVRLKGKA
ncbi:MAG TPA: VWA domain-containing protein, partial [Vicinamibacterales bacterium]